MKTRSNRRRKRGIKALFCFLLAAELTLGSLSTPAQAEASEITTPEAGTEGTAEPADTTPPPEKIEEKPDANDQGNGNTETGKQENGNTEPDKQEQKPTEPEEPPVDKPTTEEPTIDDPTTEEPTVDDPATEEPTIDDPTIEKLPECTCTILCTEDSFNAECPVCGETPSLCALAPQEKAPQMQLLSDLEEKPPVKGVGEAFHDQAPDWNHLYYRVMKGGGVEVIQDARQYAPDFLAGQTLRIPPTATDEHGNTYPVVRIGLAAFSDGNSYGAGGGFSGVSFPDSVTEIGHFAFAGSALEKITIPDHIETIEPDAFHHCTKLEEVTMESGVKTIRYDTFSHCTVLKTLDIPDSVTTIEGGAFQGSGLTTVNQESGLTTVKLPKSITTINEYVFRGCPNLTEVTIPDNITQIKYQAFYNCGKLEEVTILNGSAKLDEDAFDNCFNLTSLYIAVLRPDGTVGRVVADTNVFTNSVTNRHLFLTADGKTPLDADTFASAKEDYDLADGSEDGLWYGWIIDEPPAPATYKVTIQTRLNTVPWNEFPWNEVPWNKVPWNESEHPKKTFALSKDGGKTYITDLTTEADGKYSIEVADGTYEIYEITETAARAVSYVDTGVTVTVNGGDANAEVNYYTATFYDGSDLYDSTTDYPPQIVLHGQCVVEPSQTPTKDGFDFDSWKTEDNGSILFNFESPLIDKAANIYASWKATAEEPVTYRITATAHEGGSISPDGTFDVEEGTNQPFTIQAYTGYQIQSVRVNGFDRGRIDGFTLLNVDRNYTIEVSFEKTEPGGGDEPGPDTPGGGGGGTDPDNPSGGGGSDPDDSDDDHSGGGSDAGGSGGGNSGGTSDSGSDAGSSGGGNSGGSTDSTNLSAGSSLPEAGAPAKTAGTVSGTNVNSPRPGEPKTGDASHLEVYASIAMIAGFVYLILYLMDGMKGMSEEEKNRRIASLLGWAKRGRARTLRRYLAITAVFFVLAYYHAFGKQAALGWQKA